MIKNHRNNLTEEEKQVLIDGKTEKPFSGEYNDFDQKGFYVCKLCNLKLFESKCKFN